MTFLDKKWLTHMVSILFVGFLGACSSNSQTAYAPVKNSPIPLAYYDQYLNLAEQAIQHKKYREAKRLLEKVFLKYPDNAKAKLLVAEMQLSRGKVKLAAESFKRLLDDAEIKAKAMQGYGLSLLISGKAGDAETYLKKAVTLDESLWRAWNGLGYYYDSRQDWVNSENSYGRAIALQHYVAILYNNRGFSRILQKRTEDAIADLLKAIQLDPKDNTAKLNLQLAWASAGQYQQAMSLEQQNSPASGLNNVGYVALMKGDYLNAESFLTQAMETSYWFHERAWKNLGLLRSIRDIETNQTGEEKLHNQ